MCIWLGSSRKSFRAKAVSSPKPFLALTHMVVVFLSSSSCYYSVLYHPCVAYLLTTSLYMAELMWKELSMISFKPFILVFSSIALTQMQVDGARQTFPCFDEPAFKANFNITIFHQQDLNHHAISNMPPVSHRVSIL